MFEGQRLAYVVPGYTGHIPKKVYDDYQPLEKEKGQSKIPGYAGYVPSIKPENLYANTFGKITYNVSNGDFLKGQNYETKHRYISTQTATNIHPSEMLQRTAADIVGVPNTKIVVQEPTDIPKTSSKQNQFELVKTEEFRKAMQGQTNQWNQQNIIQHEGKDYVKLGHPLPGYTGFGKRVLASNIFGRTFAECLKQARHDDENLKHQKKTNFHQQYHAEPPLKF